MLGVDILIFVILGTQDKEFTRLLDAIQKQIDNGNINKNEKIIVQAGCTKYKSKDMEIKDYISIKDFEELIDLVSSGKADVMKMVSGIYNMEDAEKAFESLAHNDGSLAKLLIKIND